MVVERYGRGHPGEDFSPYEVLYGGVKLKHWWMNFIPMRKRRYEPKIECGKRFTHELGGYLLICMSGEGIRDIFRLDG